MERGDLRDALAAQPWVEPLRGLGVAVVGGAVRDVLLGREGPVDIDLVTEGTVGAVAAAIGGDTVEHDRFGTARLIRDGQVFDLVRARTETYASPGALPVVAPGSWIEDLERRDFSVNAISVGIDDGEVRCVEHAFEDLERGVLRVLHDRSFLDDPTRLLRLARYAARLGFDVEERTAELAADAIAGGALGTISLARIARELRLALAEPDAVAILSGLEGLGALAAFLPGARVLPAVAAKVESPAAQFASAVLDVDRIVLARFLVDGEFEAPFRDAVLDAARDPDGLGAAAIAAGNDDADLAAVMRPRSVEAATLAAALTPEAVPAVTRWLADLRHITLDITGEDLIAAGLSQGPAIGTALTAALDARLRGSAPDRATQLACALEAGRAA